MPDATLDLLHEYIAQHRRLGVVDPQLFLDRVVTREERTELAALIDGYLARAPRRVWEPDAFRQSVAALAVADGLERSVHGVAGTWPTLLPRLRQRARVSRRELVERLAGALGASGKEERVAGYYHEMEQGLLPAAGVSDRVLAALATIVGGSAQALREAGQALIEGPSPAAGGGPAFARAAAPDPEYSAAPATAAADEAASEEPPEPDELDRLFLGGA